MLVVSDTDGLHPSVSPPVPAHKQDQILLSKIPWAAEKLDWNILFSRARPQPAAVPIRSCTKTHRIAAVTSLPLHLECLLWKHPGKITVHIASPRLPKERWYLGVWFTSAGLVCFVTMATATSREIHASISEGRQHLRCSFLFEWDSFILQSGSEAHALNCRFYWQQEKGCGKSMFVSRVGRYCLKFLLFFGDIRNIQN